MHLQGVFELFGFRAGIHDDPFRFQRDDIFDMRRKGLRPEVYGQRVNAAFYQLNGGSDRYALYFRYRRVHGYDRIPFFLKKAHRFMRVPFRIVACAQHRYFDFYVFQEPLLSGMIIRIDFYVIIGEIAGLGNRGYPGAIPQIYLDWDDLFFQRLYHLIFVEPRGTLVLKHRDTA